MSTMTNSPPAAAERFVTVAELQARYGLARSVAYRLTARLGPRRPPAGLYWSQLEVWLRAHPGYLDPEDSPDQR